MKLGTAPAIDEGFLATLPFDKNHLKFKNEKLNKLICSIEEEASLCLLGPDLTLCGTSSTLFPEYVQCKLAANASTANTSSWMNNEQLYCAYKDELEILNICEKFFVDEYSTFEGVDTMHSLLSIGNEIFKGSRPRNETEAKIVNNFIRKKSELMSFE